ncbi:MAG: M48 family metallopeptidase [Planctomycetota bacterium]
MQLIPVLLVAIVLAAPMGVGRLDGYAVETSMTLAAVFTPLVVLMAFQWWVVRRCRRQVILGQVRRGMRRLDRWDHRIRWLIVLHLAVVVFVYGWVDCVRTFTGDLVLVDECAALLPSMLALLGGWWWHYPLERLLRDAPLVRAMDTGRVWYHMPARATYVLQQARTHIMLMLAPLLLIVGANEAVTSLLAHTMTDAPPWVGELASVGATATVFLFAPLLARVVLAVEPIASGELRDDLMNVCRAHNIGVRNILVWRTGGAMINAAVMGLIAPLRYVMLTDGLLEQMERDQVIAVMAHEIGHARRHHLPWMLVAMLGLLGALSIGIGAILHGVGQLPIEWTEFSVAITELAAILVALIMALLCFGWISRRFERQADTFAAQHISGMTRQSDEDARAITPAAVHSVAGALGSIAALNAVDPRRSNWRHGSIQWRQEYLHSIAGKPILQLAIDRLVRWVKIGATVLFVVFAAYQWSIWSGPEAGASQEDSASPIVDSEDTP